MFDELFGVIMPANIESEFIDASLFLGMHRVQEIARIAAKNYFVDALEMKKPIFMNLEQIGLCDDYIWKLARELQDAYYPFMDLFHSTLNIRRVSYTDKDILLAIATGASADASITQRLLVAQALVNKTILVTLDDALIGISGVKGLGLQKVEEKKFNLELEELYQKSLSVKI